MTTVALEPFVEVQPHRGWRRRAAFALLLLTNLALFLRPAEMLSASQPLPIYEVLIVACLLLSLPELMERLTGRSMAATPIAACVLGLLPAIALSHVVNAYVGQAARSAVDFARVAAYFLLVLALVDSPERLTRLLRWFAWLALTLAVLALLGFYGVIGIEAIAPLKEVVRNEWGEESFVLRLRGPGIFNDPNDLCLILVPGMVLWVWMSRAGRRRRCLLTAAALAVFAVALFLTGSRGGFLVLLAAVVAFLYTRLGWRRMLPWACVALPLLFIAFAGRQTKIDLSDRSDTAQMRIQLWSDGLGLLRSKPLFGIGQGNYADQVGLAAHNSFVHCYTELGLLGGTLFFAAFYLALREMHRTRGLSADADLIRLQPYLFSTIAGYAAGLLSLSRSYAVPTYLMLALGAVYLRLAVPTDAKLRLNARLLHRVALASAIFLVATHVFVRINVRWK